MLSEPDLAAIDLPSIALSLCEHVEANAQTIASIQAIDCRHSAPATRDARDHIVARAADIARAGGIVALMARHEGLSESFLAQLVALETPAPAAPRLVVDNPPPRGVLLRRLAEIIPWRFPAPAPGPAVAHAVEVA